MAYPQNLPNLHPIWSPNPKPHIRLPRPRREPFKVQRRTLSTYPGLCVLLDALDRIRILARVYLLERRKRAFILRLGEEEERKHKLCTGKDSTKAVPPLRRYGIGNFAGEENPNCCETDLYSLLAHEGLAALVEEEDLLFFTRQYITFNLGAGTVLDYLGYHRNECFTLSSS